MARNLSCLGAFVCNASVVGPVRVFSASFASSVFFDVFVSSLISRCFFFCHFLPVESPEVASCLLYVVKEAVSSFYECCFSFTLSLISAILAADVCSLSLKSSSSVM